MSASRRPSTPSAAPGAYVPSGFDAAYQRLRAAITGGEYAPHQHLVEAELATTLGVGRALVRAILIRLQEDGLVRIERNRGARVRAFSREEALEILRVREALEGLAASLAATRSSEAELGGIESIVAAMDGAIRAGDLLDYSSLNGELHRAISNAAHHVTLARTLATLHFPLIRYQFRTVLAPGRKESSLAEHREIVAALLARDAAGAERAMRRHLANVASVLGQLENVAAP